ncbi:MAG TPA: hypothetical protein V6C91_17015, partial [Coleofasciculaceae cyanobacterium]
ILALAGDRCYRNSLHYCAWRRNGLASSPPIPLWDLSMSSVRSILLSCKSAIAASFSIWRWVQERYP